MGGYAEYVLRSRRDRTIVASYYQVPVSGWYCYCCCWLQYFSFDSSVVRDYTVLSTDLRVQQYPSAFRDIYITVVSSNSVRAESYEIYPSRDH